MISPETAVDDTGSAASRTTAQGRRGTTPVARPMAFERGVVVLVGLLALLSALAALLVGTGWLGVFRAARSVLDPLVMRWWTEFPEIANPAAIVLGLVLVALGVWWVRRALRQESRPDFTLDSSPRGRLSVTAPALTDAIRADAESVTGVVRARVRTVGRPHRPGVRLTLWLEEEAKVREVWAELDDKVLSRARHALEADTLPTAIRLELNRAPRQRVR